MLQRSCVIFWVTQDSSIVFCMLFLPLKIFLFIYVCIQWFQTKTKWFSIPPAAWFKLNTTTMFSSCEIKGLYSTSIYVSAPVGSNHVNMCVCTCFCFILEVFCCFGSGFFFATLACGIQLKAKYWIAHTRLRRQTPQLANENATADLVCKAAALCEAPSKTSPFLVSVLHWKNLLHGQHHFQSS